MEELGRLSRFLGLDHDDDFLKSVSDVCSIDVMRERKKHLWEGMGLADPSTLMYRKGRCGVVVEVEVVVVVVVVGVCVCVCVCVCMCVCVCVCVCVCEYLCVYG